MKPKTPLTERQIEVLRKVVSGDQYKMIGDDLGISTHSVSRHLDNIREALKIKPLALLVHYALANKLVKNQYEK